MSVLFLHLQYYARQCSLAGLLCLNHTHYYLFTCMHSRTSSNTWSGYPGLLLSQGQTSSPGFLKLWYTNLWILISQLGRKCSYSLLYKQKILLQSKTSRGKGHDHNDKNSLLFAYCCSRNHLEACGHNFYYFGVSCRLNFHWN